MRGATAGGAGGGAGARLEGSAYGCPAPGAGSPFSAEAGEAVVCFGEGVRVLGGGLEGEGDQAHFPDGLEEGVVVPGADVGSVGGGEAVVGVWGEGAEGVGRDGGGGQVPLERAGCGAFEVEEDDGAAGGCQRGVPPWGLTRVGGRLGCSCSPNRGIAHPLLTNRPHC